MRRFFRIIYRSFFGLFIRLNLGYFFRSNKKIILRSLLGALGVVVTFVTVAALIPSHKYKDVVTVGDLSITNTEVVEYESDFDAYKDNGGLGRLNDGELDRRDHYEMAFDDNFRSIVLQDKAKECGIKLDDSLNNESLNYDEYQFTLMRERNDNWERMLRDCVINTKNLFYVIINYELASVFEKEDVSQEEALAFYDSAKRRLDEIKVLFEQNKSSEEIIEAVNNSNITNQAERTTIKAIQAGFNRCLAATDCFNRDIELVNEHPYLDGIINANDIYHTELINEGDWEGIITADNGTFAIYRVEDTGGEYDSWADVYQDMKDKYAYDEVPTAILGTIKSLASGFLSFIDSIVYACNTIYPIFDVVDEFNAPINHLFGGTPNTNNAWCGSTLYLTNYLVTDSGARNGYQICPGDSNTLTGVTGRGGREPFIEDPSVFPNCSKGPINCANQNVFGELINNSEFADEDIISCTVDGNGYLKWFGIDPFGVIPCAELNGPNGNYNFSGDQVANQWENISITFKVVVRAQFQPAARSEIQGSDRDNYGDPNSALNHKIVENGSITDTITAYVPEGGGDWKTGAQVTFTNVLYRCNRAMPQTTWDGSNPDVASCAVIESKDMLFDGPGSQDVIFSGLTTAGYYYVATYMDKNAEANAGVANYLKESFYSNFHDDNEGALVKLKVEGESKVATSYFDNNTTNVIDRLTLTSNGWINRLSGEAVRVTICVNMYGPYQDPLTVNSTVPTDRPAVVNSVCHTINSAQSSTEINFNFGSGSIFTPGYYYFTHFIEGTTTEDKNVVIATSESRVLVDETSVRKFQPYATSDVVNGDGNNMKYVNPGNTEYIRDALDFRVATSLTNANDNIAADNTQWLKVGGSYVPVNFCVTAYGPYQQPQNQINQEISGGNGVLESSIPAGYLSNNKKATICQTANGPEDQNGSDPGDLTYDFNANGWEPGYYYFVTTVNRTDNFYNNNYLSATISGNSNNSTTVGGAFSNATVRDLMIGSWISEFNPNSPEDEWGFAQFQPFVTSNAEEVWVNDPQNVASPTISDTLTSHAAKNLQEANDGYQSNEDLAVYWPKNSSGTYETATFCAVAFGPYQTAQAGTSYSSSATQTIYSPPTDPNGVAGPISSEERCQEFTGPEVRKTFTWRTDNWRSGYYYFMSYFRKANPTGTTNPPGLQGNNNNPVFIGDWTSQFNPRDEREAVADKFQIKAASETRSSNSDGNPMTVDTGIPADTASNSSAGHSTSEPDGIVDGQDSGSAVTVLKPTDTYIEDSIYIRAYDTNSSTDVSDDEKHWLKDLNGNYISFYVCANVYGPYQQPQGADTSVSAPRSPAASYIGQIGVPNITPNYYGNTSSRQQCFWTDSAGNSSTTNGLASSPTYSSNRNGGPGEYKVRWDNSGSNYFQPGYYYIVWNVKKDASSSNDDTDGTGDCANIAGTNTFCTTVDMGSGRVTQENGDFLVSDWYSPFGEQSESFYSQFQPIARSEIPEFEANENTNESARTKSEGNEGIVMECDENKYNNLVNYVDSLEEYPNEMLHCNKIKDNIYLGAVSNNSISGTSVYDTNINDLYWPKNKDGLWEVVKFQVKLHGPFSDADFEETITDSAVGMAGGTMVSTVPANVYAAQSVYAQPIAESCVITTSPQADVGGPNWDGSPDPIEVIFTQDFGSCHGNTPYETTIELPPGIYTSVVEIVRDDEQSWPIKYNSNYSQNGNSTQSYPMHNMIIRDRFTSFWGDPKETLMVPVPLYIITRRDNSAQDTFIDQVTINDQYWVFGFDSEYADANGDRVPWKDIFGNNIPKYGEYEGDSGYFNADIKGQSIAVELYGPYPLADGRPNENDEYCRTDRLVQNGRWILPAEDTDNFGRDLPYPSPLTLYEKGWYVYQYKFEGGERISNITTQCGDTNEMFRIIKNEIGLVTSAYADSPTAPTRITDTVVVTGNFTDDDKGSIVKLSLYKSARGNEVRPGLTGLDGAPLCTIIFTVDNAGTYSTVPYIDADGYVLEKELGEGRCYASDGGHYYWIEEFLRPGSNYLDPTESDFIQPIGTGASPEDLDILPPTTPEVTTDADSATSVNQPFRDTALVEGIPEGNTKEYYLHFTAYGPYPDGQMNCTDNLIYSSEANPITVTENGEYYSDYITVSSNGLVYWVEHLLDKDGNIVDEGVCGAVRETTYVVNISQTDTFDPFQVYPLYPDSGYLSRQVSKVVAFGAVTMLGAWQLTSKNSWLLRKRR